MRFEIFRQSTVGVDCLDKPHPGAQWNAEENRFEIHFTDLRSLVNFAEKEGAPIAIIAAESASSDDPGRKGRIMEYVFVVIHGERGEGGLVVGVFATRARAKEVALSHVAHFSGGWQPSENDDLYFTNGCDFIRVEKHKVRER